MPQVVQQGGRYLDWTGTAAARLAGALQRMFELGYDLVVEGLPLFSM